MPDIDLDFDERYQGTRECPDRVPLRGEVIGMTTAHEGPTT
jgi:hypothetical protein